MGESIYSDFLPRAHASISFAMRLLLLFTRPYYTRDGDCVLLMKRWRGKWYVLQEHMGEQ